MSNSTTLTVIGVVGTVPEVRYSRDGRKIVSFRLASTDRKFDSAQNSWVDSGTNWFTVASFKQLADHVELSVHKGDPVVVFGRLKLTPWEKPPAKGMNVDLEAEIVGFNLRWGTATFQRSISSARDSSLGAGVDAQTGEIREEGAEVDPPEESSSESVDQWAAPMTLETVDAPF